MKQNRLTKIRFELISHEKRKGVVNKMKEGVKTAMTKSQSNESFMKKRKNKLHFV